MHARIVVNADQLDLPLFERALKLRYMHILYSLLIPPDEIFWPQTIWLMHQTYNIIV